LGSIAYQNLELVKEAAQKNPGKVGITIDVRDNKVTIPGYIVAANKTAMDYANRFRDIGVSIFAYSNVDTNGNTTAAQIEEIRKFCMESHIPTICTNQLNTQNELGDILKLEAYGIIGVVMDKAIYENKIDLASAVTFINDQTLSGNDEPTLIPD
jgi:phosphoribosylformimino-5-aminoimidazole carboxamide ribotide isomerase